MAEIDTCIKVKKVAMRMKVANQIYHNYVFRGYESRSIPGNYDSMFAEKELNVKLTTLCMMKFWPMVRIENNMTRNYMSL